MLLSYKNENICYYSRDNASILLPGLVPSNKEKQDDKIHNVSI